MKDEELLNVLIQTNRKRENPVDENILKQILSIVIINPLDEDRGISQEQIRYIISKSGGEKNENNKD